MKKKGTRSILRFSDGVSIDASGPHRVIRETDGLYVVGKGVCTPVETHDEGSALIRELNAIEQHHSETRH
jgi:hypothetical protein